MSLNHASSVATHIPQSLPSFAQAFSSTSLGNISQGNISLPPIQTRPHSSDLRVKTPTMTISRPGSEEASSSQRVSRKRARVEESPPTQGENESDNETSRSTRVKEEPDQDMLQSSPEPAQPERLLDISGAPPPSSVHLNPSKRRRVTVSGAPQPGALNTDVRAPADPAGSTPISPVVIGFSMPSQRDNPNAAEQVRSMISVKQKQKALIEQRRGSVAGIVSPGLTGAPTASDDRSTPSKAPPPSSRPIRLSPNSGTGSRRLTNTAGGSTHPPSPSPGAIVIPTPQQIVPTQTSSPSVNPHSLPPPPISFARRRANQLGGQGKKKPADIVISPREAYTKEQLALSIQSAPPIPHAGGQQGSFYSGRVPMTLPRLPSVLGGGENVKRVVTGNVPPTPTRLSLQRNPSGSGQVAHPIPGISGRSPPNASVAISSTLVPPTPSSLHHPGYSGGKAAFLAPFEMFYDALNDSKQLKAWLSEQLQKSQALVQNLNQQQDRLHELVEGLVDKRMSGMRAEMAGMQRRIDELEDTLRTPNGGRRPSIEMPGTHKTKEKQMARNGIVPTGPMAPESYTFPPVAPSDRDRLMSEHDRRISSPGWTHDRDRDCQSGRESENGSPGPFGSRRLSVSASRLDPIPRGDGPSQPRSLNVQSPPTSHRESTHHVSGKMLRRPGLHRRQSSPRLSERERRASSPPLPLRREDGRSSIVLSPRESSGTSERDG
ncbi:uncharacterized protein ARMOST_10696 [Armillaria ostoyae]|uniref:Uncharacterized protein n=2 Tax=Armillaria TaxID=47424 RepID=A0A284RF22_ARMOS|nr:hypothetical protein ARMSODRAFT_486578 [Armillaria solidipes]SJL07349.1 uncharacterized protein ARMOST_10696 [Armillaria ostoyae]